MTQASEKQEDQEYFNGLSERIMKKVTWRNNSLVFNNYRIDYKRTVGFI